MHQHPLPLSQIHPVGAQQGAGLRAFRLPAILGLMVAAFGFGRQSVVRAPVELASPELVQLGSMDPQEAATQVSRALQAASAGAAKSVVQVRSFTGWRGARQEGSGVIVSKDGLVVTNHHVVDGGTRFEVVFTDGTKETAKLLGSDSTIDLAVLRLETRIDYEPMALRMELPPVGELVLAVGNPLSLGHTVTLGVVNGLGRDGLDIADYENYIQTDAAINPGNSGGPLIDVQGRAIGITVAVGLESNGDGGLAFAIPAAMVSRVVDDIVEHGRVRRAYLGVQTRSENRYNDPTVPERKAGYKGQSRVKIRSVYDNTPADRAGLRNGDIILSIGRTAMIRRASFRNALIEADPGDRVPIKIWRAGKELTKTVELEDRDRPDAKK